VSDTLFEDVRLGSEADLPPADTHCLDVALLDMSHGIVNLGHDAMLASVAANAARLEPQLRAAGLRMRAISFDVRKRRQLPHHSRRFVLYLGTAGPGHLEPQRNVRDDPAGELIEEDAGWEAPLFALFDAIRADENAALLGVCYTFGLLCRWTGVARPLLRPAAKSPIMAVKQNVLSEAALAHPWFSQFAAQLPDGSQFPVLDSRHYDLVPAGRFPEGVTSLARELLLDGNPGPAMTMCEFARSKNGRLPRIFGVNFNAEIGDVESLDVLLRAKIERGECDSDWYRSRAALFPELRSDPQRERLRLIAAGYCFDVLARAHLEAAIERVG
jgi:hypothetical protein